MARCELKALNLSDEVHAVGLGCLDPLADPQHCS